jgi:1-acyl-sn-glycerol-3-phosphate acyltransferase
MHPEVQETIALLEQAEARDGFDPFGFRPGAVRRILPWSHALYRSWFRVQTEGLADLPSGRVLLIANHSGQLPYDGAMIATALLLECRPPRVTRSMVERWVPSLPFVSTLFARAGQVVGTPDNAIRLLEREQTVLVFPEGTRGISKPPRLKYRLQRFGTGFMRLALQTRTPIVPVGVVGAEEQLPVLGEWPAMARALRMPVLPILPTLGIPLPVRYRILFGEPLYFDGDADEEDRLIQARVDRVRASIESLLARGLSARRHPFE